jgi:DNA-binding NarL/FixJ family response regulator
MLKAMIVEDSIPFREMFKGGLLSQFPPMEVFEAGNGEEAFKKLASYSIGLIFMDIRLPGQNGLELTRTIKAGWQDIPVIILTSYDIPEYREAAIGYGANSFIAKDSLKWDEISTLIKCYQRAKQNGREPACSGFTSESKF